MVSCLRLPVALLTALLLSFAAASLCADAGEFSIRSVSPLNQQQLQALRQIVATEGDAAVLAERIREEAQPHLGADPHPLKVIHYEGLLNTDPRRIATVQKLQDMDAVAALLRYWQTSESEPAAAALQRHIVAWSRRYTPTGNDVNENKLFPLLAAYFCLRDTGDLFSTDEKQEVETWVSGMAALHQDALGKDSRNNRYTKRLRLLLIFGMILDRDDYLQMARVGVKRFVSEGLYANGESVDLRTRDSLTYHISALEPVVEIALLLGQESLYTWQSPRGASLKQSVDYVLPYATGEQTREEWTHSTIPLDQKRAAAGIQKYQPGHLFDPHDALELMLRAEYFDPKLRQVITKLSPRAETTYPHWQLLVNEACRLAKERLHVPPKRLEATTTSYED